MPIASVLVGLSLGPDDGAVLAHLRALAPRIGVERVRLLHVVPAGTDLHQAPEVQARIEDELAAAAASLAPLPASGSVVAGRVALRLLQEAVEVDADLICMGRRAPGKSPTLGMSTGTVVRKAPCSVLVVPRDHPVDLSRILVPVDFSERSQEALQLGTELADPEGAVLAVNAYELPLGWSNTGQSEELVDSRMRKLAEDEWAAMVPSITTQVELTFRSLRDPHSHLTQVPHASTLARFVEVEKPGLVLVPSRGRTRGAALLIGSVATRLVNRIAEPVLVLKNKGETLDVLHALRII